MMLPRFFAAYPPCKNERLARSMRLSRLSMRKTLIRLTALASFALLCAPPPALAVSKEIIQLQTQVQQLQDMLQHLQQSNDERMGVLQHLVEQTADNVNRMTAQMDALNKTVREENDATAAKVDGVSGQTQNLNDSVDELKSRVAKLDKQLQDIQAQLQNLNTPAQPGAAGSPATPPQGAAPAAQPPQAQAPPVEQLYQSGLRDYNTARYDIATSEFSDVLKFYPQDELAGNAQFYVGEIAYRQAQFPDAVKAYDAVIEQYPGNPKVPAAQLRKGEALIATNKRDAGVLELRSLIQRHPQTPEAQQARSRLNALGVRITPTKPTPYR
jgi:tol-pal system protein YbgF